MSRNLLTGLSYTGILGLAVGGFIFISRGTDHLLDKMYYIGCLEIFVGLIFCKWITKINL